jgi:hypothetical protein
MFCPIQTLDISSKENYRLRRTVTNGSLIYQEDVTMSTPNTRLMDAEDCIICRTVLGFLSLPLLLLMAAATAIAL